MKYLFWLFLFCSFQVNAQNPYQSKDSLLIVNRTLKGTSVSIGEELQGRVIGDCFGWYGTYNTSLYINYKISNKSVPIGLDLKFNYKYYHNLGINYFYFNGKNIDYSISYHFTKFHECYYLKNSFGFEFQSKKIYDDNFKIFKTELIINRQLNRFFNTSYFIFGGDYFETLNSNTMKSYGFHIGFLKNYKNNKILMKYNYFLNLRIYNIKLTHNFRYFDLGVEYNRFFNINEYFLSIAYNLFIKKY
jgi:hypothetical protein